MSSDLQIDELELAWLAGLLEGEGSFMHSPPSDHGRPRISLEMTDQDIVERVARMFTVTYMHTRQYAVPKHQRGFRLLLRGQKAVRLMRRLRPLMGQRRSGRIDEILNLYVEKPAAVAKLTNDAVRDIRTKRMSMRQFAAFYDVSKGTIQRVQEKKYYKSVE